MEKQTQTDVIPSSLLDAVQQAANETFTKISGQETVCEMKDYEKIQGVFGSISFTGDRIWSLTLGVPRSTAIALGPVFAGFDVPFGSPEMGDLIGELTHVLATVVIAELAKEQFHAQMTFPSVARGHESGLLTPKSLPSVRLCFNSLAGKFWVKITMMPKSS